MRLLPLVLVAACGHPLDEPWCADGGDEPLPAERAVSWWHDVRPIVEEHCTQCHTDGGIGDFPLHDYADASDKADRLADEVRARRMPPWLPADCCTPIYHDNSLTDEQISTLTGWAEQGAPEGDPEDAVAPGPPAAGLSRVDLTIDLPAYTPDPPDGETDELRCFSADFPDGGPRFVTGLAPRPGARELVHHIVIATIGPKDAHVLDEREAEDDRPGFDCSGGMGSVLSVRPLGGSLQGGDFPRGLGSEVPDGSRLVVQIHYSLHDLATEEDQTSIDLRLDETAVDSRGIAIANPAWLIGRGMLVAKGESDVTYWYKFHPDLFTLGKAVDIQGVTPHMHRYGSRFRLMEVHEDGSTTCLLEIPDWRFGWEQPYWLEETVPLAKSDQLYVECQFDNSAKGQPNGGEPRDIAWGEGDQDMCAGFLSYTVAQ